jgi:putative ABC transport system permease protein
LILGDTVLGSNAAKLLDKRVADTILSDQINLYSLAAQYPLKMKVVGVLSPAGSADDDVIFVDLKTAWIIEGLAHGHDDLADDDQQQSILGVENNNIIGNANVTTYVEITDDNIAGFHLHGDQNNLPLTSIICVPNDNKSATILKGRHTLSKDRQILAPTTVIDELLRIVFKIEVLLHASLTIVAVAIAMLLGLIVLLSIRLRKREFETLHAIGCSRKTVVGMVLAEWSVILISSLLASGLFILLSLRLVPNISYLL